MVRHGQRLVRDCLDGDGPGDTGSVRSIGLNCDKSTGTITILPSRIPGEEPIWFAREVNVPFCYFSKAPKSAFLSHYMSASIRIADLARGQFYRDIVLDRVTSS